MLFTKLRGASLAALVAFLGCNSSDVAPAAPIEPGRASGDTPRGFAASHTNESVGAPSFVWLSRSDWPTFQTAEIAANEVLTAVAPTFNLKAAARATLQAAIIHDSGHGPILAKFAQRVDEVEVFRGGLNVVMSRGFEPVAATGLVATNISRGKGGFQSEAASALAIAHKKLTGHDASFSPLDTQGDYQRFASSSASFPLAQPARAKRVYFPSKGGLEAGWFTELLLASGVSHTFVVSAATGKVLFSNDLVKYDAYSYRVWADPTTKLPMDGPQGNDAVPLVAPTRNGFKPPFVPSNLVTLQNFPFSQNDPWLPPASTTTVGNNVRAYSDVGQPDGYSPNAGDTLSQTTTDATFDYAYDSANTSAGSTPEAVKASITQMFYTTNFLHDWFYDSGFDEKSGNHQKINFGRGGMQNDPLLAETQDFSGRNNANAATPPDGASPRIQMYLFGGATNASLTVDAPAPNAGVKAVGAAGQFGKDSFDLSGPVAVVSDGGGTDAADACENINSSLAGKIGLAHRGNCSFVQKAQKVQAAGGIGIIVVNVASSSSPGTPPFMGGTALDVTIPALSLNLADGQALESAATGAVMVNLKRAPSRDLDGALDDQIVSHEWGHVLSNRLVADGSGLDTNMAGGLGEGWADFLAQLVTVRPDDALVAANAGWNGVYPSATYATGGDSEFYFGIRRVPYSTDMTKDPLTFKHIADGTPLPGTAPISYGEDGSSNSEVHNTGEVWATMLWECYASLLRDSRFTFKEAQDRMKSYLIASLKLTPPSPTMLEARDAVLAAAYANDPKDFELFWKAFAKRGAGVGAVAPPRDAVDNNPVKESFEVGNAASLVSLSLKDDVITCDHDGILDEGELGTIVVKIRNSGAGTLSETTATLSSKSDKVTFPDKGIVKFEPFKPFEEKTALVKAYVDGVAAKEPLIIDIAVDDPAMVAAGSLAIALPVKHGVDEIADSSITDDVETNSTAWAATGTDQTGTSVEWARILTGTNHSWFIPNAGEPADHQLTSPAFEVTDTTFTLAWKHRWSFESSVKDTKDFDGGVVEITLDNGKTWVDLSKYAKMDYNVTLEDDPATMMVLKGRKAYGGESAGYPDTWVDSNIVVTLPTAGASVKVRFRHGADDNSASVGWELDDITVDGLTNKPFWSFVPQRDLCDPAGPTAVAPPGQSATPKQIVNLVGSGTHPKNLPLGFYWSQVAGPSVFLSGRTTANVAFEAPETKKPVTITLALRANDGALLSAPVTVDVVVGPAGLPGSTDDGGCGCRLVASPRAASSAALWTAGLASLVLVLARRRRNRAV